jgi:hypothetical protein
MMLDTQKTAPQVVTEAGALIDPAAIAEELEALAAT